MRAAHPPHHVTMELELDQIQCVSPSFSSLSPFQAGKAGARSVAKNLLAEVVWIYEGSEAGVLSGGIGGAGL